MWRLMTCGSTSKSISTILLTFDCAGGVSGTLHSGHSSCLVSCTSFSLLIDVGKIAFWGGSSPIKGGDYNNVEVYYRLKFELDA